VFAPVANIWNESGMLNTTLPVAGPLQGSVFFHEDSVNKCCNSLKSLKNKSNYRGFGMIEHGMGVGFSVRTLFVDDMAAASVQKMNLDKGLKLVDSGFLT
jgi:hypothetical protein